MSASATLRRDRTATTIPRPPVTGDSFGTAAKAVTRQVPRSIFDDPDFWELPDAIDEDERIRQWHENNIDVHHSEESESFHYTTWKVIGKNG
jgi:hypothetical protein